MCCHRDTAKLIFGKMRARFLVVIILEQGDTVAVVMAKAMQWLWNYFGLQKLFLVSLFFMRCVHCHNGCGEGLF